MFSMKHTMLALAATLAMATATAQTVPADQQGRPAGAPDMFAVWKAAAAVDTLRTVDGKLPPLNAKGQALYNKRVKARAAGKPIDDGTVECLPHGLPRLMLSDYPFRLYQKPTFVAFAHELTHYFRVAYLNEKSKDVDDLDPTYTGYPVSVYEGDTLVVTSNGFNDETTMDRSGLPKSAALVLTERYRLINGGKQLELNFTVDDKTWYTKPWTARMVYDRGEVNQTLNEYVCTDQNPEATRK